MLGVVVLDDCREAKPRSAAELAVLKNRFYQQRHQTRSHPSCPWEAELMVLLERERLLLNARQNSKGK